jgi:hypothetical protein
MNNDCPGGNNRFFTLALDGGHFTNLDWSTIDDSRSSFVMTCRRNEAHMET